MSRISPFLLFLAAFVIGCSSDDGFFERAAMPPSGIIQTDIDGRILDEPAGQTDWEVAPGYVGRIRFEPAYPNPAGIADEVRIRVWIHGDAGVNSLEIEHIQDFQVRRSPDSWNVSGGGTYLLQFVPAVLFGDVGLYRIFIVDDRGAIISYGDILVQ